MEYSDEWVKEIFRTLRANYVDESDDSGKKIFVSYKFHDDNVMHLPSSNREKTIARDYVNEIENLLDKSYHNHIYKGEEDGESLKGLDDEVIWEKLKDRIYDSSITIVLISPGMREAGIPERDQWIPWEISYSLKEVNRRNKKGKPVTSHTNAMIGVVLPDREGSYEYFIAPHTCCDSRCEIYSMNTIFAIIRDNMFNLKDSSKSWACSKGLTIWSGSDTSYLKPVRWDEFISNPDKYIEDAVRRQDNVDDYKLRKEV